MFADRNLVNRRNVVTDVSENIDSCKQFFLLEIQAKVVACVVDVLGISAIDDQ